MAASAMTLEILQVLLDKAHATDATRFWAMGLLANLERLVAISPARHRP